MEKSVIDYKQGLRFISFKLKVSGQKLVGEMVKKRAGSNFRPKYLLCRSQNATIYWIRNIIE
tara:strand:+ start:117 stop:302 length:186 start_codon:yes stop_codon:yes gene_type:complete